MKDRAPCSIDLDRVMVDYLQEMVKKYGLDDMGKAMRCLVNLARDDERYEKAAFGEVRCLDC
jgi:hypothetical protein